MATEFKPPVFEPQRHDEQPLAFGYRTLQFVMNPEFFCYFGQLDLFALEQALHASMYAVASPDMSATARETVHTVRLRLHTEITRRKAQAAKDLARVMESVYPKGGQMPGPRMRNADMAPKPLLPSEGATAELPKPPQRTTVTVGGSHTLSYDEAF